MEESLNYWQTDHIRLRAMEERDVAAVMQWNEDSSVGEFMEFLWPPQSPERIRDFVAEQSRKSLQNDGYFWVIEDLAGQVVGHIDTRCEPRHGTFEYGVSVIAAERGKGYASAAIMKVVAYYFDKLRYQKVTAGVHSDNLPSQRLHESLGFSLEGTLRSMVYRDGGYVDLLYYGLTLADYRQR